MSIVLFDTNRRSGLFPLTYTRALAGLRSGIYTNKERWEIVSGEAVFVHTEKYLQPLYQRIPAGEHLWIDAAVVANDALVSTILALSKDEALADENGMIAARMNIDADNFDTAELFSQLKLSKHQTPVKRLEHPWQLMLWNDDMIRRDFALITKGRLSEPVPASVNTISPENIFLEDGAKLAFCTLNASTGPIYIGKNAEIMEGSVIRGPFVLGEYSVLKLNSRVYGATSLGPYCMGGGEIKNTVMMGHSNKAHDGYLGDSVVGEWCNFGAGSTCSNIKNTAGTVKIWDMHTKQYLPAGQKCGVIMGDYSRVAINSSINTGTVIGISSNVFGAGLLPTIVDNFQWGVTGTGYEFDKALKDIDNWKRLKGQSLNNAETSVLQYLFES